MLAEEPRLGYWAARGLGAVEKEVSDGQFNCL